MKWFVCCCIMACMLPACDPMRRIEMKNKSDEKAVIIWTIKEDSINSSPFFISSSREVRFELTPEKPGNIISMSFGTKTWTPSEVKKLADDLDSLVIRRGAHELKLTTEREIIQYLLHKRKGLDKSRIEIVL